MKKKKIKWNNIILLFNITITLILYFTLNNNINSNMIKLTSILLLTLSSIAITSK
jgi:hypothetical protein